MNKKYPEAKDYVGKYFSNSKVIGHSRNKYGETLILKCECGKEYETTKLNLIHEIKHHCGCKLYKSNRIIFKDYFKKWSENMAYISGFTLADGCLNKINKKTPNSSDKYYLNYCLRNDKDNNILIDFMKKEFDINNKTTHTKRNESCGCFAIPMEFHKEMLNDLSRLGIVQRKTGSDFLPNIPNQYFGIWLRGFFDGDGCISKNKNRKKCTCCIAGGNKIFLKKLADNIRIFIPDLSTYIDKQNENTYSLVIVRNIDIINLGYLMYTNNNICLERKYKKFVENGYFSIDKTKEEIINNFLIKNRIRTTI